MSKLCPNGHEVNDNLRFCPKCGAELKDNGTRFCKKCGTERKGTEKFCSKCGNSFEGVPTPQPISQPTPSYDAPETSTDYRKIIIPIVIGLVILALIGGGWYGFKTYKANKEVKKERYSIPIDTDTIASGPSTKEIITKRLEEIFEDVNNGKAKDCDERYFSSEFKQIFKKVEDIDRRIAEDGSIGFWDFTFWEKSQELVDMKVFVDDVCDIKANEATAKLIIKRTIDGNTFTEKQDVKIVFEDDKWVLDDWYDYKNEMKKFYEENKDYQPSAEQSNID